MAQHRFVCDTCGNTLTDTNTKGVHVCECGETMRWDVTITQSRGDYNHTSDSLAFHPDDIPEHRQRFPDIEVTPEGRPCFTSTKQQEKYAEKCGFHKKSQRQRTGRLGSVRIY